MTGNYLSNQKGFSLIELMVVLTVIALLIAIATPVVGSAITRAKEAALQENLKVMRKALDHYYADKGAFPTALEILVEEGYIKAIPPDTVNEGKKEWAIVLDEQENGISQIHSKSEVKGSNDTPYNEW